MDILCDFAAYPEWYPGARYIELLPYAAEEDATVRLVLDPELPSFGLIDVVLRFFVFEFPSGLEAQFVSGRGISIHDNHWTLTPDAAHTRVRYALDLDLDVHAHGALHVGDRVLSRAAHLLIQAPLEALRQRAEATVRSRPSLR